MKRLSYWLLVGLLFVGCSRSGEEATPAAATEKTPIKIGVITELTAYAENSIAFRDGMALAVSQVNAAGGVLGRPLEMIVRDAKGDPANALRAADELLTRDKIDVLTYSTYSHVAQALSSWAKDHQVLLLAEATADSLTLESGHRYTFILSPSAYTYAKVLVEQIAALPERKVAIIAPNFEFGHSMVNNLKTMLGELQPKVDITSIQFPALGKLDAGPTILAIEQSKPEIIVSLLISPDSAKFVREGKVRGLFDGRTVITLAGGWRNEMDVLGAENPVGWYATGYPGENLELPGHQPFVDAYREAYGVELKNGSLAGFAIAQSLVAGINKAGSVDTEKLIDALEDNQFATPIGPLAYRGIDHRSTLGSWIGKIDVIDGRGELVDYSYKSGEQYMPSPEMVKARRP